MMLTEAKVVALALFPTFLLAICAQSRSHHTCRHSCGEIRDIRSPFGLESDPSGCGFNAYKLVCEKNRTVVYLRGHCNIRLRYYVADINHKRRTIRVVDPGVEKGNCFSTPHNPLLRDVPNYYPYHLNTMRNTDTIVLMNCQQPISDGNYIAVNPCNTTNLTSSSSQAQPYVYALLGGQSMVLGDITYSCTVVMTIIIPKLLKPDNISASDLQEVMLQGLDLSFYDEPLTILQSLYFDFILPTLQLSSLMAMGIVGMAVPGILCMLSYLIYKFRRRHLSFDDGIEEFLCNHQNFQPIKYSYSKIKKMTHNFKDKLGQGGFGLVYKGKLRSGHIVAIKMLIMSKSNGQDFINEVSTI